MNCILCGRVADPRLDRVQTTCPLWTKRSLRHGGFTGTFYLICAGSVLYRVHPEPIRVYRSRVTPSTIMLEAWPRNGTIGVMYGLITPEEHEVALVLEALKSRTHKYGKCLT